MSYNTRRNQNFMSKSYNNNISNVGMRRPQQTTNFVHGGQLLAQNKPVVTIPMNQQRQQRHPQQQRQPPQQQNAQQTPQQPPPIVAQQQQVAGNPVNEEKKPNLIELQLSQQELPAIDGSNDVEMKEQNVLETKEAEINESIPDGNPVKPWSGGKTKKITKKERLRRRNMRLYKILTPKNAVMVLNELIKNVEFTVSDEPQMSAEGQLYDASVSIDGKHYHGYGRTKSLAKNYAAEAALKFLVKNKRFHANHRQEDEVKNEDNNNEDSTDADETGLGLPWQQVASFALFKLFSSWGDDPIQISNVSGPLLNDSTTSDSFETNKPAKRMPPNPEQMNPLMLMNQMLPNAKFEEMMKQGNPPNCIFSFKCIVDDDVFMGSGKNKKTAKKNAAFAVCNKVLGVQYPPEIYAPLELQ